jgi:hypothetical protein
MPVPSNHKLNAHSHVTLDDEAVEQPVERNERKFLVVLPKAYTDKFEAHLQNVDAVECSDEESDARDELPQASKPKPRPRLVRSSRGTGELDPIIDLATGT